MTVSATWYPQVTSKKKKKVEAGKSEGRASSQLCKQCNKNATGSLYTINATGERCSFCQLECGLDYCGRHGLVLVDMAKRRRREAGGALVSFSS